MNKFFSDNTTVTKLKGPNNKTIQNITQKNADFVNPPSSLNRNTLLRYREIARKALVGKKGDPAGAQKIRIELIDEALKNK